jgi:hypothetical protein
MRRGFPIVLTCILSLLLASIVGVSAAVPDDCDCSASDGSCSASISCQGGCTRFCGPGGNCYAECSGDYQFLGAETTLELQNATYPELVTALAHQSGKQVVFAPMKPDLIFNVGFKRAPFWSTLELLSDQGTVQVGGQDFEKLRKLRKILLAGDRITLCVKKTPLATFISDMVGLTGLPLRVTAGSPMALVNIRVSDATLDEMLSKVSEQTGTKIVVISDLAQQSAP